MSSYARTKSPRDEVEEKVENKAPVNQVQSVNKYQRKPVNQPVQ